MIALLIKASLVISVLLVFYKLFLEKERFFAVNRIYLMAVLGLAVVLPFVTLPKLFKNQGVVDDWLTENASKKEIGRSVESLSTESEVFRQNTAFTWEYEVASNPDGTTTKDIFYWLSLLYILGVALSSINFMVQLLKVGWNILRATDRMKNGIHTIFSSEMEGGPCSFFGYIFIDPCKYDSTTYEQILAHEKIHVRKKHSIDLILAEITIIVLWFNPIIWFFRKAVETNIEYETDAILLNSKTVDAQNYQLSLLQIATESNPFTSVSKLPAGHVGYHQSLIKKRIVMMNKRKSNTNSYFKYAFLVPTLFAIILVLNQPFALQAQELTTSDFSEEEGDGAYYEDDNGHSEELTPFLRAAADGNEETVMMLIDEGANVNEFQRGEGTALYLALQHSHLEVAELLIEQGADPNFGSRSDGYPIMLAVADGNLDLVQLLVKKGADVNRKYPGDGSALILASKLGHLEMVKLLVDLNADINMPVKHDGNPLIMAAKAGHLTVVEYLTDLGADVNYEVLDDETPIINASEQGHLPVVKFLVENGADINKPSTDYKGRLRTALKMAEKNGHDAIVIYLKRNGAKK